MCGGWLGAEPETGRPLRVCPCCRVSVVKAYCGHGIGDLFHCAPNVPHYAPNKALGIMRVGDVFTVEPMVRGPRGGTQRALVQSKDHGRVPECAHLFAPPPPRRSSTLAATVTRPGLTAGACLQGSGRHGGNWGLRDAACCFSGAPCLPAGPVTQTPAHPHLPPRRTAVTEDGARSAQFEHTLVITEGGCEILTARLPTSPPLWWEAEA